jgi:hypothetical protein
MVLLFISGAARAGYYFTYQTKPTQETAWMSLDRLSGDHTAESTVTSGAKTATGMLVPGAGGTSAVVHPTFIVASRREHTSGSRHVTYNRTLALDQRALHARHALGTTRRSGTSGASSVRPFLHTCPRTTRTDLCHLQLIHPALLGMNKTRAACCAHISMYRVYE